MRGRPGGQQGSEKRDGPPGWLGFTLLPAYLPGLRLLSAVAPPSPLAMVTAEVRREGGDLEGNPGLSPVSRSLSRTVEGEFRGVGKKGQACVQLARILQYLECPQ